MISVLAAVSMRFGVAAVAAVALVGPSACSDTPAGIAVVLPDASPGIGFDDLRYSPMLERVLVPAGRSGNLDLIQPDTTDVTAIGGFGSSPEYTGGHEDGPTSVDEGRGFLFVTDRTAGLLRVVDPQKGAIVGAAPVASAPDYVRYVDATGELWVTEPGAERIEVFRLDMASPPKLSHTAFLTVSAGPESLVIDAKRGRAYTHLWHGTTIAIDVKTRAVSGRWNNGCDSSRGIALDEPRGYLFAACAEGKVTVLAVDHDGAIVSDYAEAAGLDVIGYSPERAHLFVAGAASETMGILAVSSAGRLSLLGEFDTTDGASCATADDHGHAWVCAPDQGALLRIDDTFPPSR